MEDKLMLEILTILGRSKNAGREAVKSEILNMAEFADIGQSEFVSAWDTLLANGCIQEFRNDQKNNAREYRLNPSKDCIQTYSKKVTEKERQNISKMQMEDLELKISEMTLEALQRDKDNESLKKQLDEALLRLSKSQHEDIPKNATDRKVALICAIIGAITGWLAYLYETLKSS